MMKFPENCGKLQKFYTMKDLLLLSVLGPGAGKLSFEVYSAVCTLSFFMAPCGYKKCLPPPIKRMFTPQSLEPLNMLGYKVKGN